MADEKQVAVYVQETVPKLSGYAMREYKQEAFQRSVMLALVVNPDLRKKLDTPAGKSSMMQALRKAATTGLSLNPQEGKAALIPYGDKIQYQVMKGGMIDLAMGTGKVDFITSDTVRSGDVWEMEKTPSGDVYKFSPARKGRGDIDGVFAAVRLTDGTSHVKYMDIDQIKAHRAQFSPHTKMPEEGYALKTVLKALLRGLNIAPEVDAAVGADDEAEYVDEPAPVRDVTPKGVSGDDVSEKLAAKKQKQAEKPTVPDAEPDATPTDEELF